MKKTTLMVARLGIMTALGIILALLIHFSIFPAAPYLEYDPADVPVLITSFLFGPWCGVIVAFAVSLIQGFTVSAGSGIIGIVMHILATGSFALVTGFMYRKKKTVGRALASLAIGSVVMAAVMAGCNMVFTPMFTGRPASEIAALLLPVIIPFNLIKALINSVVTFLVYKPISKIIKHDDTI